MSLIAATETNWNPEALASLHERYPRDWRYPRTGWDNLMLSDELQGVQMTEAMLRQLADPYRWKDGGTDRENGSGSWVPISELWGAHKSTGVLRQAEDGTWTHHPMGYDKDTKAGQAIIKAIRSADLAGYTLRLSQASDGDQAARFELLRSGESIGVVTADDITQALKVLRARHTLFANALGVTPPSVKRVIVKNSYGGYTVEDEDGNSDVHYPVKDKDEVIARATQQLKGVGGGQLIVDRQASRVYPDQTRYVRYVDGGYVVYNQDERRIDAYLTEGSAIRQCTKSLQVLGGGRIVLTDESEIVVEAARETLTNTQEQGE